jgi:hypothetical protein
MTGSSVRLEGAQMRSKDKTERSRGLGPFTGRQLTTIVCVIAAMVMLPVGAFAVSGTNSFITDQATGKHATVTGAGQLVTTGASLKNLGPSAPIGMNGTCKKVQTVGGSGGYIAQSLTIAWHDLTPGSDFLDVWRNNACDSPIAFVEVPTPSGSISISLGNGVAIKAGQSLSATSFGPHPTGWVINAPGYSVPGSAL